MNYFVNTLASIDLLLSLLLEFKQASVAAVTTANRELKLHIMLATSLPSSNRCNSTAGAVRVEASNKEE